MRIGMVCPYSFDEPGGVQVHVMDLARALRRRGHDVRVLAPGAFGTEPEDWVTFTGRSVPIPYNGSVARLSFGPITWWRTRRWLRAQPLDVLHIHEPNTPSVGLATLMLSSGPIVATFHTSATSSLVLAILQGVLAPHLEKIRGRIAVSELARRWQIEALGSDAVVVPNGVDVSFYAAHADAAQRPATAPPTITFLGRYDEPRKGMDVLVGALPEVAAAVPGLRLQVMGGGDEKALRKRLPDGLDVEFLGRVSDEDKARTLAEGDVYCAPNTGGESFGIVLVEALAAGTAVVASDLDAFRRVLDDGTCGELFAVGDSGALGGALIRVLTDPEHRAHLVDAGRASVSRFDWPLVTRRVTRVYETIRGPGEQLHVR